MKRFKPNSFLSGDKYDQSTARKVGIALLWACGYTIAALLDIRGVYLFTSMLGLGIWFTVMGFFTEQDK